jgi:hypothetical protein
MVDATPDFRVSDGTGPLTVDGTVTANLGTLGDAATETTLSAINGKLNSLGQKTKAGSVPVVLASDSDPLSVVLTNNPTSFSFGDVTLAAIAQAVIRRTAYTEQTTNAQRSIASASANDTAAGTGARTVRITYYTATFTGPFTEDITLNGTTYVNTAASNICYIENIKVLTAGSGGSNAGILTLKASTAGGGATIGTINAGDNQTFWAHHYVPTGKSAYITGISVSHSGTTVGSGAVFLVKSKDLSVTNGVESQVTDFVRLYGQASTFARVYQSSIKIIGPARLIVYVTPETSSSTIYRASIDYNEV